MPNPRALVLRMLKKKAAFVSICLPLMMVATTHNASAQAYQYNIGVSWTQENYSAKPTNNAYPPCDNNIYYACMVVGAYDATHYPAGWTGATSGVANAPIFLAINNVYNTQYTTGSSTGMNGLRGLITVVSGCCSNTFTFLGAQTTNNGTGHGSCTILSGYYVYRGGTPSTPFFVEQSVIEPYANYQIAIPYSCATA